MKKNITWLEADQLTFFFGGGGYGFFLKKIVCFALDDEKKKSWFRVTKEKKFVLDNILNNINA